MLEVVSRVLQKPFCSRGGFGVISLGPNFWDHEDMVTAEENALLERPFF
jgi:hypothetical protein